MQWGRLTKGYPGLLCATFATSCKSVIAST